MQSSAVKRQIAMLDMDTSSFLLSLLSAPSWNCLENNKKSGPKAKAKILCPPIYQEWTSISSSAVQNITQRPAKNPQHSTSKLTKLHGLILLLITIIIITAVIDPWKNTIQFAPFLNCLLSEISWAFPPSSPQWKDHEFSLPAKQLIHT